MANQVKIKINKVKDRSPEERLAWRRKYLKRKGERKAEHNRSVREKVSNLRRTLRKATEAKDEAKANEILQKMHSALDKAAKVGVIHKRTAARRKSRLSKSVAALKAS
jgi:small subunit ribosomal protein S20|tara:strand:- start:400 stop:723 length:324 start_codon:yes stop_codon:yes gene_type:complete